jgi:tRNA G18 (ribose-2'-O)-methylase SpoU
MPFARVPSIPVILGELRRDGFALVALTPAAAATDIRTCASALVGRRTAIVLGHEGEGLSAQTRNACDYEARIPMAAGVDSLNVASASAVALHELYV